MDDPFMKSLLPADAAMLALQSMRLEVANFAYHAAQALAKSGYSRSRHVLVDRGRRTEHKTWYGKRWQEVEYDQDTAWSISYFFPHGPGSRRMYLLVDGNLALSIFRHKDNEPNPDRLQIFDVSSLPDINECQNLATWIGAQLIIGRCRTNELVRLFKRIRSR